MSYLDSYIRANPLHCEDSQSDLDGRFINYTLPSIYNNFDSSKFEEENYSENEKSKIGDNNGLQDNEISSENKNDYVIKKTDTETVNKEIINNDLKIKIKGRIKKIFIKRKIKRKERIIIIYCFKKRNRKKKIPSRKYNTDNIRRKIIAKFFKYLIKNINNNLRLMRIKKKFKFLPAEFIKKFISKVINEKNKSKVDFTF